MILILEFLFLIIAILFIINYSFFEQPHGDPAGWIVLLFVIITMLFVFLISLKDCLYYCIECIT